MAPSTAASCRACARTAWTGPAATGRFDRGLYGCSEMFVNGFLQLIEAGIIRREVFADATLQRLLNSGAIADETVTPATLSGAARGRPHPVAAARSRPVDFLLHFGVLRAGVRLGRPAPGAGRPPLQHRPG
jgi:hypothetical protein